MSKIFLPHGSNSDRGIFAAAGVRAVGEVVTATAVANACCMTSAALSGTDLGTCMCDTRNIVAPAARSTLVRTSPTSRRREATTPNASSPWRSGSWSKMACRTASPRGISGATTAFLSRSPRSKIGLRLRGKKSSTRVETEYLDWALADFSGYLAADELYDGPFCVLSVVDSQQQRRLLYEVLDRNPTRVDVLCFLARLNDQIRVRGRSALGITTDASPLYPQPLALVFGNIPHQICEFHILKELTKAVLRVLAQLRKQLAAQAPKLSRGRPKNTPESQRQHRHAQTIQNRVADLFEERYLFVRHHLTAAQRTTLQRLVRFHRPLKAVRAIRDEVYRLFDRRCRTDTALAKLTRLRRRIRRYRSLGKALDKLHSPNLEKALTFLDEKLLPATSNAVERGNRRYRKMQKTVYRVRTQAALVGRVALDLQREQQADGRSSTVSCLQKDRAMT
jgi:hypothetical protein